MAKKKTATKRSSKKATTKKTVSSAIRSDGIDVQKVRDAFEVLRDALSTCRVQAVGVADSGEVPQELIELAWEAHRSKDLVSEMYDLFVVTSKRVRDGGGSFEKGAFSVEFETVKGRRSTAWKEIAVANRRELMEAREVPFDKENYLKQVSAATAPKPDSVKPVIREVA